MQQVFTNLSTSGFKRGFHQSSLRIMWVNISMGFRLLLSHNMYKYLDCNQMAVDMDHMHSPTLPRGNCRFVGSPLKDFCAIFAKTMNQLGCTDFQK